ncbi:hypothetical protein VB712_00070 [Spirulina sp. CCNP1310]|uniref:hypothetical protein n=1 Tax=Spirulina sp. CCNP1310 TaxID=3110249 RepID=UPI002B21F0E9|nr:hypothetical protein [Spirulina sp. CCNP1310]MEA5417596.1 hypothetical protein [Spirulina sp. CCNP1310]
MKVVSLTFPGRFEDAFLYMGRLFTITENHSVCVYDMKRIISKLEEEKDLLDAPTLLFFRNDWIDSEQFRHRLGDELKKKAFLRAIEKLESEPIQITTDFVQPIEWDLGITADILLDLNIYNGRAYIGTNKGLYHLDLDWEAESITPIAKAQKRLDAKCVHTTARYGTVNASCGSEGWFSFLDDFDLGASNTRREKHIPEYSLKTNWLDFDVVNYPTSISPTLFSSVRTAASQAFSESKQNFDLEQERWIVTDLEDEEFSLDNLFDNLNHGFSFENLQFVYNSSQALFLSTYDEYFFALHLERRSSSAPTVSRVSDFKGLKGLVSSLHTISAGRKPGLILETDEQILLFANCKFIPLFHDEVISIRTFSRSRHYRNIVSITTSDEIKLIAIFDDKA